MQALLGLYYDALLFCVESDNGYKMLRVQSDIILVKDIKADGSVWGNSSC